MVFSMVKIKICGNQDRDDLMTSAGANAVGFIVATSESGRNISLEDAMHLEKEVPLFTSTVIVTTETNTELLKKIIGKIGPDYLQLHSSLTPKRIEEIAAVTGNRTGIITLLSVEGKPRDLQKRAGELADSPAKAILLDSKSGNRAGGTGKIHNWKLSREIRDTLYPFPVILAGGLNPENVSEAVKTVKPYGVDVATGVEEAGKKSEKKIECFLEEVKNCET